MVFRLCSANAPPLSPSPFVPPFRSSGLSPGQVIEFESKGLHYQELTKGGMTVMYAPIPSHIKDFSVIQVAITNGTGITWVVKNQDFKFIRQDGEVDPVLGRHRRRILASEGQS